MIGFLCATPYHIIAATTIAAGQFKDEKSVLVVMDHAANVDEAFVERIRGCNIFTEVHLYKSNNKTKLNNIKRLVNAFVPPRIVKMLAKRDFSRFFCFALDFIDITYLIKKFKNKNKECEFVFADDGIGSYVNPEIYAPRPVSEKILKLNGRKKYLDEIKKLYVYKPEFVTINTNGYELVRIEQTEDSLTALRVLTAALWPLDSRVELGGKILYFEQPYGLDNGDAIVSKEISLLKKVTDKYCLSAAIKMHPRSTADELWSDFDIIRSKIPFEAMLIQQDCQPRAFMSNCSTALFSCYLLDGIGDGCETVMVYDLVGMPNSSADSPFVKLKNIINEKTGCERIHMPSDEQTLMDIFASLS